MSGLAPYGVAHPQCQGPRGHVCQRPSGHRCIERDCDREAGTLWGPAWCPQHDQQRLQRISSQFKSLLDGPR